MINEFRPSVKMKPKEQWICDHCGELIDGVKNGWLEWYSDADDSIVHSNTGFRIVHYHKRCMYNQQSMFNQGKIVSDMHLKDFAGDDGLVYLLSFFESQRVKDVEEFTDIIRRMHTSYYEEARQYWGLAEEAGFFDGSNEVWPYLEKTLLEVIRRYSRK